eukprot:TRINITY_DN3874_c0_g1_i5.p3 TRINITY_DN3874_c0_g1~~TRINITY_DN3874_c0_g1_i5.p3  ORF type:complete len:207 (-),score=27.31 TRINITY_DN3874_c0_g1_i5:174-794(-)
MHGFFEVPKIPGNFHISYHDRYDLIDFLQETEPFLYHGLHLDFEVISLTIGDQTLRPWISKRFKNFNFTTLSTLQGFSRRAKAKSHHDFYMKLIPNRFVDYDGKTYVDGLYQYSIASISKGLVDEDTPIIVFNYEISPVTISFRKSGASTLHFIVQICAIAGGIFSAIGILNSLTEALFRVLKRQQGNQQMIGTRSLAFFLFIQCR